MRFGARKSHNAPNNIIQSADVSKTRNDIKIHAVGCEREMDQADQPTDDATEESTFVFSSCVK